MKKRALFSNTETGAVFSKDRVFRYELWRYWGDRSNLCNFLMLNPSTADEFKNDPTVERCERRARAWGYGGLIVTNIFAYRATDPQALRRVRYPVGPENDEAILKCAQRASIVVCAWGTHGLYMNRSKQVRSLLRDIRLHCLKLSSVGEPCHPLYLPYSLKPVLMEK